MYFKKRKYVGFFENPHIKPGVFQTMDVLHSKKRIKWVQIRVGKCHAKKNAVFFLAANGKNAIKNAKMP